MQPRMGLTCSEQIARSILCVFSLALSALSLIVIIIGGVALSSLYDRNPAVEVDYDGGVQIAWVFLATGCVMFVTGMLGCCGAACKSELTMKLYAVLLVMFMALLVTILVLAFRNSSGAKEIINSTLEKSMMHYGDNSTANSDSSEAWDSMQSGLECCGSTNYKSWNVTMDKGDVPSSCCVAYKKDNATNCDNQPDEMWQNGRGCTDVLYGISTEYTVEIVVCAVLVITVDLLALTASCWLSNTFYRQGSGGYEVL